MPVSGSQTPSFEENLQRSPDDPPRAARSSREAMLEIFVRTYGIESVVLWPHNAYDLSQNITNLFGNVREISINRILRGKSPIICGDGGHTRAYSYI
jgi:UDP-glucose 4-epimerase